MFPAQCIGGYVLLAKQDGRLSTWTYTSPLWTTSNTLNPTSFALDMTEAKLDAFNLFPVSTLRLGMEIIGTSSINWLTLPIPGAASTLLSKMSSGNFIPTSVGRAAWKSLIGPTSSLQLNCNAEGLNNFQGYYNAVGAGSITGEVRIGIVANQEADCASPDSAIGFGIYSNEASPGVWCINTFVTVGDSPGTCNPDNGSANTVVFGYILGA